IAATHQLGYCFGIAAGKQRNVVALAHQLVSQVRNHMHQLFPNVLRSTSHVAAHSWRRPRSLLQIIIGYMREAFQSMIWRANSELGPAAKYLKRRVIDYFQQNIHVTTSGYYAAPDALAGPVVAKDSRRRTGFCRVRSHAAGQ